MDRERLSCHNSECARKHTTFYNMTGLVLMGCVKPWPGMNVMARTEWVLWRDWWLPFGGGELQEFKWNCWGEICLCPCRARDLCSTELPWLMLVLVTEVLFRTVTYVCFFFFSFLLWIEISPWQMILCPNCPKVTPSCEISWAVSMGAEPRVEASCILISCGLSSLMKWMVVVGHLTLGFFAVFVSERRQKAQLQQRSWKLQVWAWLENAKLPSVVRLCGGSFFCRLFA